MPKHRTKNPSMNVPIAAPRCGVQPVVYYPSSPWNSISNSAQQEHRQRPKLSYHHSDASDFISYRPNGAYPNSSPTSPRSPEFANHLKFQPMSEPQRIIRSTSANSLHVLEQIVDRQDQIRKHMRDTISGWKVVAKHIPKTGKNISVNEQMKRIRGLCANIDQHLRQWKDELYRLTGSRIVSRPQAVEINDSNMKDSLQKQLASNEVRKSELHNLEKCLQDVKKENSQLKEKVSNLGLDLRKLVQEKEELLTRLSEVSGSKLTDGNVQFTDLSTQNRPTTIAENFRELYDDEWMEALEALPNEDPVAEKKSISTLLYIVKSSFEYCKNECAEMKKRLVSAVYGDFKQKKELNNESKRLIRELQKSSSGVMSPEIADKFCSSLDIDENFEHPLPENVKIFASKCARVTWCMVVQSPPMQIICDGNHGSTLDRDLFSEYTQQGEKLDFIVWPAVLIENDGALLSKGVAQPFKKNT